jgi:hypothetical protein
MGTPKQPSHLFVLRLWCTELDKGKIEWRGEIHAVASRERRYFREWSVLREFLLHQMRIEREDEFLWSNKNSME